MGVRRAVQAVVPLLLPLERPPHAAAAEAALQNLVLQPRHHRVDVDVVRALDDYALRAFEVDGVRPRLSRRKHAAADGGTVEAQPLAGPRRAPLAAGAASVALALPLAASPAGSPAATLDRRRGRGRVRRRRRRRRTPHRVGAVGAVVAVVAAALFARVWPRRRGQRRRDHRRCRPMKGVGDLHAPVGEMPLRLLLLPGAGRRRHRRLRLRTRSLLVPRHAGRVCQCGWAH